jgi:hypothetical protein
MVFDVSLSAVGQVMTDRLLEVPLLRPVRGLKVVDLKPVSCGFFENDRCHMFFFPGIDNFVESARGLKTWNMSPKGGVIQTSQASLVWNW